MATAHLTTDFLCGILSKTRVKVFLTIWQLKETVQRVSDIFFKISSFLDKFGIDLSHRAELCHLGLIIGVLDKFKV